MWHSKLTQRLILWILTSICCGECCCDCVDVIRLCRLLLCEWKKKKSQFEEIRCDWEVWNESTRNFEKWKVVQALRHTNKNNLKFDRENSETETKRGKEFQEKIKDLLLPWITVSVSGRLNKRLSSSVFCFIIAAFFSCNTTNKKERTNDQ